MVANSLLREPTKLNFNNSNQPVAKVADAHGVVQQQYADDTQLHIAMSKMSSMNAVVQLKTVSLLYTNGWPRMDSR